MGVAIAEGSTAGPAATSIEGPASRPVEELVAEGFDTEVPVDTAKVVPYPVGRWFC